MTSPLPDLVLQSCLFEGLSEQSIAAIVRSATKRQYDRKTEVLSQGSAPSGMIMILSGHVSISVVDAAGHQSNLIRLGAGDILGDLETIAQKPCLASCTTEPGCQILIWPSQALQPLLHNTTFVRNLIRLSYERMAIVNQVRTLEHFSKVEHRIMDCLLRMSLHDPVIKRSQSYLAETVGCSRQTVNKTLGALRDEGLVVLRKSVIEVTDRAGLAARLDSELA